MVPWRVVIVYCNKDKHVHGDLAIARTNRTIVQLCRLLLSQSIRMAVSTALLFRTGKDTRSMLYITIGIDHQGECARDCVEIYVCCDLLLTQKN